MNPEKILSDLRAAIVKAEAVIARAEGRRDLTGIPPVHLQRVETIATVVCGITGVTRSQLYSRSRPESVASARHICMALIRAKIGLSSNQVGRIFDRDHCAVLHAERSVNNRISIDSAFAVYFGHIKTAVENQLKSL